MATLFNVDKFFRKQDFRVNPRRLVPGKSKYQHFFGGPIADVEPKLARAPLHVLFNLDLRDPLLKFLQIDAKRLPLVFPINVDGAMVEYAIKPNGGIKLFGKPLGARSADWPYPGYPTAFEKIPVQVRELTYEQYRATQLRYQIGPEQWLRKDDRKILETLGSHFTQLGGVQEKPFGDPFERNCPDPKCRLHELIATEIFIGIHDEPIPGMSLWDQNGEGFIAFSMCRECKSIRAQTMID